MSTRSSHPQPSKADLNDIERCKAQVQQARVDRNAYDASAGDLWDLKQLLGIAEWNLFGVSYGGRTAESFLRKHPNGARSLILDSPQVTGILFVFGFSRLSKIGEFFSQCAAADACGRQFQDLKMHFERTIARSEQNPLPMNIDGKLQTLTARAYIRVVTWVLYIKPESAFTQLSAAIVAASGANYAPLLALEDRYADADPVQRSQPGQYPVELTVHIAQQTEVLCAEEYPYLPRLNGRLDLPFPTGWSPATRRVVIAEQEAEASVCDWWDFKPSDRHQGSLPPVNSIPTLIVHGDHDTIAPSDDQDLLACSYPNSTRVVFVWTGHAMIDRRQACFLPMLAAFVNSPTAPLNTTCAQAIKEPQWLPTSPQSGNPQSLLPIMHNLAVNQVQNFGFPGRTIHVDLDKVPVNGTVSVGSADPVSGRPLTGRDPSRMASMTKTYTSAAILRLWELGQVAPIKA